MPEIEFIRAGIPMRAGGRLADVVDHVKVLLSVSVPAVLEMFQMLSNIFLSTYDTHYVY